MRLTVVWALLVLLSEKVQSNPGNMLSKKPSKAPYRQFPDTYIPTPAPPQLPPTLSVDPFHEERYDAIPRFIPARLKQIPQYQQESIKVAAGREDLNTMLNAVVLVRHKMAAVPPTKQQFLPLYFIEGRFGKANPRKVYSMPLELDFFQGENAALLAKRAEGKQTHPVFGVTHPDPSDSYERIGKGRNIEFYGFADVENAFDAERVLPTLPYHSGLSHDLYRVLAFHP